MLEKCLVGIFRWNAIISQSRELMNVFLLILQPKANLRILFGYNDGILAEVEQVERRFSNIKLSFLNKNVLGILKLHYIRTTIFVPTTISQNDFWEIEATLSVFHETRVATTSRCIVSEKSSFT